jgi:hypothetical protein
VLKFRRVGAGSRRKLDQAPRPVQITVVIRSNVRDEISRLPLTNRLPAYDKSAFSH